MHIRRIIVLFGLLTACGSPSASNAPAAVPPTAVPSSPTALPTLVVPTSTPDPPSPPPDDRPIARAMLQAVQAQYPGLAVVAGVIAVDGQYAGGIAAPLGSRTVYVWARRQGTTWEVIEATAIPNGERLRELGVPDSVTLANDQYSIMDAALAYTQQATAQSGIALLAQRLDDWARVEIGPPDGMEAPVVIFLRTSPPGVWEALGRESDLDEAAMNRLGVPIDLRTRMR